MFGRNLLIIAAAFLFCVFAALPARGQTVQTGQSSAAQDEKPAEETADLVIIANVTARELTFEVVPTPTVTFSGNKERKTLWEAERTNLPEQVQPGVTYRNIGIRLKIVSRLADIERIVAEALGETPVTETLPPPPQQDAAPTETKQSPAPSNSSPAQPPAGEGNPL